MSLRSRVGAALRAVGLGRVADSYARSAAARAERRRLAAWQGSVLGYVDGALRPHLVAGEVQADALPVIMCMWTRPDRLGAILENLQKQDIPQGIRLIMWNNRPENGDYYVSELTRSGVAGAITSVEFFNSPDNIGGMARFVVAHQLVRDGYRGPYVTFDDDQDVSASFVSDLMANYAPNRIAGWWAWVYEDNYWDRRAAVPGEQAVYVGTPGAVFDTGSVADREFFTRIPPRYGFIEDVWASYWVTSHGGELRKVETDSQFVLEELNQFHGLIDLKVEFGQYLRDLASSER